MSTFGCHSCGVKLEEYKDRPYEEWPCATCALSKDYSRTFSTGYFETADLDSLEDEHEIDLKDDCTFVTSGKVPLKDTEIDTLATIVNAVSNQVQLMFSGLLVKLLHIAKTSPIMFEVFIKKMQFPYMSYAEIGDTMEPKCSKQNVLYHLKSIVDMFPELESVLQTDTRYTNGQYALKTIAERRKKQVAEERLQAALYNDDKYKTYRLTLKQLNQILHLPFNMREEVFKFNAYLKDEEHIDGSSSN